jgi:hypothetical protein
MCSRAWFAEMWRHFWMLSIPRSSGSRLKNRDRATATRGSEKRLPNGLRCGLPPRSRARSTSTGADKVILLMRLSGRGKTSGVDVSMSSYHVFTLLDRKIVRMHEYGPGKRKEALEAVGLRV